MSKKSTTHSSSCGNCTKCHMPGREPCPVKDFTATLARRLVTRNRSAGSLTRPRTPTRNPSHNFNGDMEEEKGQMNFRRRPCFWWNNDTHLTSQPQETRGPKQITLADISIDVTTEAFAIVDMLVASNKRASLWCKVGTGAGGNVMPLWAFAKLFPNKLMKTGMDYKNAIPSLEPTMEPTLDTPITWKDEETKE